MLHLDYKYIQLISSHLRNFRRKKDSLYNFSCPVCGDSQKNKHKARAYFIQKANQFYFHCHNCQLSLTLLNLLKRVSPALADQYQLERYRNGRNKPKAETKSAEKTVELPKLMSRNLICITQLPEDHYARQYVKSRKIPSEQLNRLYFTEDFGKLCNELFPNRYNLKKEPRLVLPFFERDGKVMGLQGRSFTNKSKLRYLTVRANDEVTLIYGIEKLDLSQRVYIVEGPIDSLFISNSVAAATSDLERVYNYYKFHDSVLVFDNEPRNREVMNIMGKAIEHGRTVCIWPETIAEKDINDIIKINGVSPEYLLKLINENVYTGLKAKLKFSHWRKC